MAGAWAAASSLLPSQMPPQPPRTPLSSEPLLWDKEGKEEAAEAEREREQGRESAENTAARDEPGLGPLLCRGPAVWPQARA